MWRVQGDRGKGVKWLSSGLRGVAGDLDAHPRVYRYFTFLHYLLKSGFKENIYMKSFVFYKGIYSYKVLFRSSLSSLPLSLPHAIHFFSGLLTAGANPF